MRFAVIQGVKGGAGFILQRVDRIHQHVQFVWFRCGHTFQGEWRGMCGWIDIV